MLRHDLELRSAYYEALGHEPEYTTANDGTVDTVDYLFFTPRSLAARPSSRDKSESRGQGLNGSSAQVCGVEVARVLLPPEFERFAAPGMPSEAVPSDHVCLLVDFVLNAA